MSDTDLTRHASFVGLLYDQTLSVREPLCAFWQVDKDTIVTTAHSIILYKDLLSALRARFPTSGHERAIRSINFHPDLDVKQLMSRAKQALVEPFPALPLQQNNVAVLKLSDKTADVSPDTVSDVTTNFERFLPPREGGLTGSLSEIELPLVVQTITNARKEGTLCLIDERFKTVGQIFCQGGKVKQVFYHGLVNEMAFYQIINHRLSGSFHFTTEDEPGWLTSVEISRSPDMLLIESLRRLDELEKLTAIVGGPSSLFERRLQTPNLDILPPDVREYSKTVWPYIDGGTPLGCMWQLCGLDDYAVYSTLQELIKTRQISYFEAPFVREADKIPIKLGLDTPLSPNDPVSALWVEDASMAPLIRRGVLLGSAKDQNPSHVVHNVALPAEACGCPIFKDQGVIGLHCGAIPPDPLVRQQEGSLHQMIWIEAVVQCLRNAGDGDLVKRLTLTGVEIPGTGGSRTPGIREVVRIKCPKCGRSSMELANFCKGCGQRLIEDLEPKGKKPRIGKSLSSGLASLTQSRLPALSQTKLPALKPPQAAPQVQPAPLPLAAATVTMLLASALTYGAAYAMPKPNIIPNMGLMLPDSPRMRLDMQEWVPGAAAPTWTVREDPNNQTFEGAEKFCIDVNVDSPSYIYCLYKGASGAVALIYPSVERLDQLVEKNTTFSIGLSDPPVLDKGDRNFQAFTFDNVAGTERFIFMASGQKAKFLTKEKGKDATDQVLFEEFVNKALDLLSTDDYVDGVETNVDRLGHKFFDDPKKAKSHVGLSGLMGDSVYLKLMELKHTPKPDEPGKADKTEKPQT
ncbi:MAG TPA: DUF4388 domain-containing protein, partial [Candidatus Obscuribacter sp.]|nr:DUF4388 domain-containing protein [Candidatus Obscuribacter sp.]